MAQFRTEYKTVETRTLAGLKQAERLQRHGWTVTNVGMFSVQMKRRFELKTRRSK